MKNTLLNDLLAVVSNWVEILIGAALAFIDLRLAFIYLMVFVVVGANRQITSLVRVIKVVDFSNSAKLIAIMDKLDISPRDIQRAINSQKRLASVEEWKRLQDDWAVVTGHPYSDLPHYPDKSTDSEAR